MINNHYIFEVTDLMTSLNYYYIIIILKIK